MVKEDITANDTGRIACKLIYLLKRYTDEWITTRLCCGNAEAFNTSQLPLFMSIGRDGISNNALADKMNISKQASSKVVKELELAGLVSSEKSGADARVMLINLTEKGAQLYNHIKVQILGLEEEYKELVGAKNYELAIDVMLQLIDFHEKQRTAIS